VEYSQNPKEFNFPEEFVNLRHEVTCPQHSNNFRMKVSDIPSGIFPTHILHLSPTGV
jgi:hypothetical protein